MTFLFPTLPSNATIPTSSNTTAVLDNVTSLNQTLSALVNQTLPALVNQTLTSLNETASEQAQLTQEARVNTSRAIEQQTQAVQAAFEDLPFSIYAMLMTAIVVVIGLPVALDLHYGRNRTNRREERYDLYRALMTFGVIIVVGIIVVYLIALINFNIVTANENVNALIEVLKNLSTILGTALAAIVAFYFGTRSAQRREGTGGGGSAQGE